SQRHRSLRLCGSGRRARRRSPVTAREPVAFQFENHSKGNDTSVDGFFEAASSSENPVRNAAMPTTITIKIEIDPAGSEDDKVTVFLNEHRLRQFSIPAHGGAQEEILEALDEIADKYLD